MRSTQLIALLSALVVLASACGGSDDDIQSFTDADSGSEVLLTQGERFLLRLESNPSTGYSWSHVASPHDPVDLVEATYEAPSGDVVGAAGTEILVFEATGSGAGVLRLEYLRPSDDDPIPDRVVEFIVRIDEAPWPPDRPPDDTDPPTTSHDSVPDQPDDPAQPDKPVIEVADLFDGRGARVAVITGYVVWDDAGARLCEVLMESYPPQCGGSWVAIADPEALDVVWAEDPQGVRWTDDRIEAEFTFDGDRLIVGDPDSTRPTTDDEALVSSFLAFVADPGPTTFAALPLADEVSLGLGPEITGTFGRDELADTERWSIDRTEHRAWAGPFSVLELVEEPVTTTIGSHPRCASPPEPAPTGLESARRVSIQPSDATSCLEWWTVDFFVDGDGLVSAITLDLFAP